MKVFWWLVVVTCVVGGTVTTALVVIEYVNGPTATSTTIRLVTTLKLPAVTICPKVPDAFNFTELFGDMRTFLPNISESGARDLARYWLGGNGLENMDGLSDFNRSYLDVLAEQYRIWSKVRPYNCTLVYMPQLPGIPKLPICDMTMIAKNYYDVVQLVLSGAKVAQECVPGCKRWDYQVSLQQTAALQPFKDYAFNLEASFNDLQYEDMREVLTTTVPGFMSQIGGQFGFFLAHSA
ncbi:hypothetical protein QR680_001657 [Steinernema hermaphroditum]|uniref:Uncharacterized protein n=1 Tax=Steinernema hermaphroditum TaxID=289476 RepID=A0AA39LFZ5_9BILA|nr:hypothetical protein QR680_001657 [Steinernema hermaphroditum]